MTDDDPEFQDVGAAITKTVRAFMDEFVSMLGRWKEVDPAYILECTLLPAE